MKQTENENINITAEDLVAIQGVIDLATRRGAFGASELSTIGKIFDKLRIFNEHIARVGATAPTDAEPKVDNELV